MLSISEYKFTTCQLFYCFKIFREINPGQKKVPISSLRASDIYAALRLVTTKHHQSCLSYVPQVWKLVTGTSLWPVCVKCWHCQCVLCSNLVIWHGAELTADALGTPGVLTAMFYQTWYLLMWSQWGGLLLPSSFNKHHFHCGCH